MSTFRHLKFLYLHPVKTGGSTVDAFSRNLGITDEQPWTNKGHTPMSSVPEYLRKFTVITTRNPWDWYMSYYHHFSMARSGVFGGSVSPSRRQGDDFRAAIARMAMMEPAQHGAPLIIPGIPNTSSAWDEAQREGIGLYTWYMGRMLAAQDFASQPSFSPSEAIQSSRALFLFTDRLNQGLELISESLDLDVKSTDMHENKTPTGGGGKRDRDRMPYPHDKDSLWCDELIWLIGQRDRLLCEVGEYGGPGHGSSFRGRLLCDSEWTSRLNGGFVIQ